MKSKDTKKKPKKLSLEEKRQQEKEKRLYKTYGITWSEWKKIQVNQGYTCAICKQYDDVCGKLCVDHIHVKGFKKMQSEEKKRYVRGLLCYLCNTGLKGFEKTADGKKNRQRLEGTYEYFQKYRLKGE